MAPSTSHGHQSSPPSESIQPKRSLRSRGSNAGIVDPRDDNNEGKETGKGSVGGGDLADARGGNFRIPCLWHRVLFEFGQLGKVGCAALGEDLLPPQDLKAISSFPWTHFGHLVCGFVVVLECRDGG